MQFGFKRGAAALTLSQTNWEREVSGELCGVTPMLMKVSDFFIESVCCEAPSGLRRSSNRWCPGTGLAINDIKVSVPLRASTAQQSAVSPCEWLISKSERHFFRSC